MVDGISSVVEGILRNIPLTYGRSETLLNFLVVKGPPFDIIIFLAKFEELQTCIDLGN